MTDGTEGEDWAKRLSDLKAVGVGVGKVALMMKIHISTVKYWKHGGRPTYLNGVRLMGLWTKFCTAQSDAAK